MGLMKRMSTDYPEQKDIVGIMLSKSICGEVITRPINMVQFKKLEEKDLKKKARKWK